MGSYVVERHISHALYGGVWLCRYKGRQSAVKRCEIIAHSSSSLTCVEDMEYIRADIESEKSVNVELAKHRHKHILHMDDHFERDGFQHLVCSDVDGCVCRLAKLARCVPGHTLPAHEVP
ncbi:Aste57867_7035 [Aphanomyces stellatus]|uniref:Aste57867_7035 protein n=1 Tax=Aphanomyces stellatus TaxID=120398 RepID=A0A485KEW4_9STRA|nr:hypothetical protein As57867_007012 [Aphanomyces stellatus]VFT83983.1 Aste57867_7035 [Aphanomyces stellatus]